MSKPYVSVRSHRVYEATLKGDRVSFEVTDLTSTEAYQLVEALEKLTTDLRDALNANNPFISKDDKK